MIVSAVKSDVMRRGALLKEENSERGFQLSNGLMQLVPNIS